MPARLTQALAAAATAATATAAAATAAWAALAACALPVAAQAASLRPMALVEEPQVRLSDLFDDAGARADAVLGPAPAPGARIVVGSAQAAAIARQYGVAWQPGFGADVAVLERPGEPVRREMLTETLRAALRVAGADDNAELEMTGFNPPMVPPRAEPRASVTQLDWDRGSGRFTALLSVEAAGMDPARVRISGRALPTMEVLVPVRRIALGEILRPEDLHPAHVRTLLVHGEVLLPPTAAADGAAAGGGAPGGGLSASGLAARRTLAAGLPVAVADLARPELVHGRARVMIELDTPGMRLTAQGTALDGGALGDRIKVLNPNSRAVMEAEVTGEGRVRVAPGSTPLVPAGRAVPGFGQ